MNKSLLLFSFLFVLAIHYLVLTRQNYIQKNNIIAKENKETNILLAKLQTLEKQVISPKPINKKQEKKQENKVVKKIPTKNEIKEEIKSIQTVKSEVQKEVKKTETITQKSTVLKETVKQIVNETKFKDEYISKLRIEIDKNKSYPKISKRLNEQGRVVIYFRVLKTGMFENIKVINSSGKERLDKAALQALYDTKKYKPFLNQSNKEYLDFNLPLLFVLN